MIQNLKYRKREWTLAAALILTVTINGLLIFLLIKSRDSAIDNRLSEPEIRMSSPVADTLLFHIKMQPFYGQSDTVHKGYYKYDIAD